ncbi:MAG TPA: ABC-F family ATP-binding cassette domain-containing protein [Edaphocola sp.]|nr:ABC-F family ATP-binding cassette domain-containing protein [Edaphocola sp.]
MLRLQNLSYTQPDKDILFSNISLSVSPNEKIALIGNNGAGKSTLLKIISGSLLPSTGLVSTASQPYYIPQIFGQYNHLSLAEALRIDKKLNALEEILGGNVSEANCTILQDDWTIEERCAEALRNWQLEGLNLSRKMGSLSGGQKTKVFLAGICLHQPELVLLDEPSNHLDAEGRKILYEFIQNSTQTFIIASHDRRLLNFLDTVCELTNKGIKIYGGNYDFYAEQKNTEANALSRDIQSKVKDLKKARVKEREIKERQQKSDSRGKGKQERSGVARIMMNTLRNSAENSTAKLKNVHAGKIGNIREELQGLRAAIPATDQMVFGFDHALLHTGKVLFAAERINFAYDNGQYLWQQPLSFEIRSGERIAIKGANGSGKTTLIKIILGARAPQTGSASVAENKAVYIDQDCSMIDNNLSVNEQAQSFNTAGLTPPDINIRLHRFLFTKEDWHKPCSVLSGGERMRLMLCCLSISNKAPDIIILDEPTNNLDIRNIDILAHVLRNYEGTLLVITHDETFLEQVNISRSIQL